MLAALIGGCTSTLRKECETRCSEEGLEYHTIYLGFKSHVCGCIEKICLGDNNEEE